MKLLAEFHLFLIQMQNSHPEKILIGLRFLKGKKKSLPLVSGKSEVCVYSEREVRQPNVEVAVP